MVYNLLVTSLWFLILKLFFCFCWNVICQSQLTIIMLRSLPLQRCWAFLIWCLCLYLDDFLTLETQLRCFFLQEALLSATVAVTLPCLASRRDLLHSVPLAVSYFGFLLPLLVSSLRQVLAAGGSWARSLLCVRLCSLKMVQVHIIAVLMGFFQSL